MLLHKINPTETIAWQELTLHFEEMKEQKMKTLFEKNKNRANELNINYNNEIFLDYSKNIINSTTLELLLKLADECKLKESIDSMFNAEKINETENREVFHVGLRQFEDKKIEINNENIYNLVNSTKLRIKQFSQKIINGNWKGYSGLEIKNIVNIGIGGSDLGPRFAVNSLKKYSNHLNIQFVSNVDEADIYEVTKNLNHQETLFIIASKTFTTQETMQNANSAVSWFKKNGGNDEDIEKHFVAVSSNIIEAKKFGIHEDNIFPMWDWVGGRYSVWSSIGLSLCLAIGYDNFDEFLKGANEIDDHFQYTDFNRNIPVILGLLGIWYNNFFSSETHAILPYDSYLDLFAKYLQQTDMESNGKSIDRNGDEIYYNTGQIIWGVCGTDSQHSFFQLLHQGTRLISSDFLVAANSLNKSDTHHNILLSNCIAQSKALAFGRDYIEEFPHKSYMGNMPSNTIIYNKLSPNILGKLMAIYEQKVFVQGVIWNIFSFDQWGVELGKIVSKEILQQIEDKIIFPNTDSSTKLIMDTINQMR